LSNSAPTWQDGLLTAYVKNLHIHNVMVIE